MTDTYTMEVSIKRAVTRVVQAAAVLVPAVCRCDLMILGSILMVLVQWCKIGFSLFPTSVDIHGQISPRRMY